jgi:serine/threonine-protein kinase
MLACQACSREIDDAAALWCPYCGASLKQDTPAATTATNSRPTPRGGGFEPDRRLSQYGPLNDARFAPGQIFASRYRVVSLLGRGAMGEVYRAEDLKLGQPVALKLVAVGAARGDKSFQRFIAEVRLAREIAHPNVCRVYDIGEAEGWQYLSMEFVDGETLQSLLRRIGRLPGEKALDMARQLCAGLAAAHDRGVLHRDLKPSNIMVDGRGQIRIMDFGLAVASGESTIGELAGTPAYMAPEQLTGRRATEQTDLYALGLVFYELFAGRPVFQARTFWDRLHDDHFPVARVAVSEIDPIVQRLIDSCLESDPAARPISALAIAAVLPGGDPLAAALAKGRVPSPEMIAAAGRKGTLHPAHAWMLLAAVLGGTVAIASQVPLLSVAPSDVPKPPDVLAERAREILARTGTDDAHVDREFWFVADPSRASLAGASVAAAAAAARGAGRIAVTFVYRQSPQYLVPQNLFRVVTDVDPPAVITGMATVTLDSTGRLIRLDRFAQQRTRSPTSAPEPDWAMLFHEAGLNPREFVPAEPHDAIAVPFENRLAWESRVGSSTPVRVIAATLDGTPVHFDVAGNDAAPKASLDPFSTGRSPAAEALLWGIAASIFAGAATLARHNLRLGQGDRRAARNLGVFVVCGGVLLGILRAHHVPLVVEEVTFLFGITGWALVWGAFTWVMYISLEPYVRRVWPNTLISWARLMSGRWRDPLVGRDVLAGLLAGIVFTGMMMVRAWSTHRAPPGVFVAPALESLRSVRLFIHTALMAQVLDALQYGLGALFLLLVIRLVVRKTWIAASLLALVAVALAFGEESAPSPFQLMFMASGGLFAMIVLLRLGLLGCVVMTFYTALLTRGPVTLDIDAWNIGTSLVALLLVATFAIYGFTIALAGRPAFGGKA